MNKEHNYKIADWLKDNSPFMGKETFKYGDVYTRFYFLIYNGEAKVFEFAYYNGLTDDKYRSYKESHLLLLDNDGLKELLEHTIPCYELRQLSGVS